MQTINFKINFTNVPESMLSAMKLLEIGGLDKEITLTFNPKENIEIFASICSLYKLDGMKAELDEMVDEVVNKHFERLLNEKHY